MSGESGSIELSFVIEGECICGVPYRIGERPDPGCIHRLVCAWGEIEHGDPRPDLGQVGHLILAPGWWLGAMLGKPARYDERYGYSSVTTQDGRLFIHMDHKAGRWTWELFPAHFEDGEGPDGMFVGRWPD